MFSDVFSFPFRCPSLSGSGSLMTSLATGGIRNIVRNHGYRSHGFSAILAQHRHGLTSVGVRRMSSGGRVSSILCLCGFSVSLFFYLFYYKYFNSRSYYSKYLARALRRILLKANGGHLLIAFNTKSSTVRSNSGSGQRSDDVSKMAEGPCSRDGEGDVSRGYLEVPSPPRGPSRRQIRRRRTRSESLEAVPERRLDFTRIVVPDADSDPRYGHVIAWLAKIVDPTGEEGEEEMVEWVDQDPGQEDLAGVSGAGGAVSSRWRETDSCSSDGVLRDSEVESRDSGYGKGEDDGSRGVGGRLEPRMQGLKKQRRGAILLRQNHEISTEFDETKLDSPLERSEEIRRDNKLDNNNNDNNDDNNNNKKSGKVFYFENDEGEEDDLHYESSLSLHDIQPRCNTGQHGQHGQHRGGADFESMRARLLGPPTHRKRTTSTGSRTSGDLFAAAGGLIRNHFSFNSTASSGYVYRESLVGKGHSIDGGEDLDRLVLLDADLGRWALADIDRLQDDLDNIRRDIGDLDWAVDALRSRDDELADLSSMYDITGTTTSTSTLKFGSRSGRGREIQDLIRRLDDWDNFAWDNDGDSQEFETGEELEDDDRSFWDGQLCRLSLSDCDDDATFSTAVHPLIQYSDVIDDGYIDDGYEVLTHLHR